MKKLFILICTLLVLISTSFAYPIYVWIMGPITDETLQSVKDQVSYELAYEAQLASEEAVADNLVVVLTTPGGNALEALAIHDYLCMLKASYRVDTVAMGYCLSAGMIILQAGDMRWATTNTYLMTHKPLYIIPSDMYLKGEDLDKLNDELINLNEMQIKIFAKRMKTDPNSIRKYFQDKQNDMWGAFQALKLGFIDAVIMDGMWKLGK